MDSRKPNDGEEGDNLEFQFAGPAGLTPVSRNGSDNGGNLVARWNRSPSPAVHRQSGEDMPLSRSMWPAGSTLTPAISSVSIPPIEPLGRSSKSLTCYKKKMKSCLKSTMMPKKDVRRLKHEYGFLRNRLLILERVYLWYRELNW